ncbi:cytochrome c [Solitalea sp. MAHUQ-68]|uniref:Cytochrome c n=1 Tax=Solitalea agri TaxID=2953739 RepID=A0A9X2FBQ8_9SPHI|nr:cytochrome c [Solitalea agri]MCO4293953.1 cytochrome c [Solitalea agri]
MKTFKKKQIRNLFTSLTIIAVSVLMGCGGGSEKKESSESSDAENTEGTTESAAVDTKAHSDSKGIGKFTDVKLNGFDVELAQKGGAAFTSKCSACHKTTDQKIVGPGLKGVTERRTPEWIMNMMTNPQEMTQKDPVAKALLAEHLTQMTFQNVSDDEARQILEFLRQNDGAK